MTDQLLEAFRTAGSDQPPSTVDVDAAVRRGRLLGARRRRRQAAGALAATVAVTAGALALAGILPGASEVSPSARPAAPGPASAAVTAPITVENTAIEDFPVVTDYGQVQWPLYAYAPTYAQENLIHRADDTLIIRCIARFGITPAYPRLPLERGSSTREMYAPHYGVADVASAEADGYGPYADMEKGGTDAFKLAYQPTDFETQVAYDVKTDGSPADPSIRDEDGDPIPPRGCARQDHDELYGPAPTWDGQPSTPDTPGSRTTVMSGTPAELLTRIVANSTSSYRGDSMALGMMFDVAREQAYKDPRRKQADALWSQCMAAKGYDYPDPSAPSNHFDAPVTERQIRTATDDVKCKLSTNYLGINAGIEAEYQEVLIATHRDLLERFSKELQEVLTNARGIVDAG